MTPVTDFLNEDKAKTCAQEIIKAFEEKGNSENIEVDFNLSKGKMIDPLHQTNTWFKFDCKESGGVLQEVFEFLTKIWRNESTTQEDAKQVKKFEDKIVENLNSYGDNNKIKNAIRKSVFKSVPEQILPIKYINFHRVELAGEDEQGYILKIEKFSKVDEETGQYSEHPQTIAKELISIHTETGKDFKEIIEEKRLAGDARYKFVADAHMKRYVRDVTVSFSADYSFCENPFVNHEKTTRSTKT